MTNQATQHKLLNPNGKAIASLILGVISVGLLLLLFVILWLLSITGIILVLAMVGRQQGLGVFLFLMILLFSALINALIGLILGIMGLKSTKRIFAIAGIVLCLIGLVVPLYFLFYIL